MDKINFVCHFCNGEFESPVHECYIYDLKGQNHKVYERKCKICKHIICTKTEYDPKII